MLTCTYGREENVNRKVMKTKKAQWEVVLEFMKANGGVITTVDAFRMVPGILRLSERIRELQMRGYKIEHGSMVGNRCAKYTLVDPQKLFQ